MRAIKTTSISILAVGLLAGSAVGVAAQDEDAPTPTPQVRVEVPEHGYAITFPEGWLVERPDDAQAQAIMETSMEVIGLDEALVEQVLSAGDRLSLTVTGPDQGCGVNVGRGVVTPPGDFARASLQMQESFGDALLDGPHYVALELPAGPAVNYRYAVDWDGLRLNFSTFEFGYGRLYWDLTCAGTEPPTDGWRSIAETFEFLWPT